MVTINISRKVAWDVLFHAACSARRDWQEMKKHLEKWPNDLYWRKRVNETFDHMVKAQKMFKALTGFKIQWC